MTVLDRRSAAPRSRRLLAGVTVAVSAAATLGLVLPAPAMAQGDATAVHDSIVSSNPADFTPVVKDGIVESEVQVGNLIVIGGTFTTLVKAGGTTTYTRTGLAAFDATTGAVSTTFNPVVNGEITSLAVSADGQSVYIGGAFNTVNGVTRKKAALVKVSDGSLVTAFNPKGISSGVADLRLVDNTLWIAGQFTKVNSIDRVALATLNATTGALTDQSTAVFAGLHHGGTTSIRELAVTPDKSKLIAIGNFTTVNGQPRDQVAVLDISGSTAALSTWQTNFFTSVCASAFDTFMRDVAVSPDGTYAVFTTTGAYRAGTSCDTISRFELTTTASGLQPTWINMTGGDTTTAVAISGPVIYIGGHFRWVNNSSAGDKPGQGAIERTALAALNPANGLPYDWNPTRERGYGVYDFLVTPQGLWVGSDTDTVGGEFHPRIALFPLAGGTPIPSSAVGNAPGDVISVGTGSVATNNASTTPVSASATASGSTTAMATSDSWSNARGAMIVGGRLFTAWSDRLMYASTLNGNTIGPRTQVNVSAGPICTTTSSQTGNVCSGNPFSVDVPNITGMFYDSGRMYYTMSTSSTLYYRYFEPGLGVVGSMRFTASGSVSGLNNARGMFLSNGKLYYADNGPGANGRLTMVSFANNTLSGSPTVVDTSRDWRSRGMALRGTPPANVKPTAAVSVDCAFLVCTADASGSHDSDGTINDYTFDFGEGQPVGGTQATRGHTFSAAGTYTVSVTVTDDDGATDMASTQVTVSDAPADTIGFRAGATLNGNTANAKVTAPTVQDGDTMLLFVTLNGVTTTTPPAGWTQVAEQSDGTPDMVTRVFRKTAAAADSGTSITVALGATQKWVTTLLAYSGVDTNAALTVASAAEPATSATHAAPSVSVATAGSWIVSYWADKASDNYGWTVPGTVTERAQSLPTVTSGRVSSEAADSGTGQAVGVRPGTSATSVASSGKATSFSIVLPPA